MVSWNNAYLTNKQLLIELVDGGIFQSTAAIYLNGQRQLLRSFHVNWSSLTRDT